MAVEQHQHLLADEQAAEAEPVVDEFGILRLNGELVVLAPIEGRLAAVLFDHAGSVVAFEALRAAGWPQATPSPNAFYVWIARLRKRLRPFNVSLLTVRGRGLLLIM
jgi:DNA-binding response OmpR family regulator